MLNRFMNISFSHIKTITLYAALFMIGMGLFTGCHTSKLTEPMRTASELLMLSYSADHAIEKMDLSSLKGKRVFMDVQYFESVDKAYVLGALREKLGKDGAILLTSEDKAEFIVEPRNRGLGVDVRSSLFGIPAMDIPVPLAGRISSPELAIYKAEKADGIASFVLAAYRKSEGLDLEISSEGAAESKFNQYRILGFIKWRSTDIPELKPTSYGVKKQLRKSGDDSK